jgi:hypothetical protein
MLRHPLIGVGDDDDGEDHGGKRSGGAVWLACCSRRRVEQRADRRQKADELSKRVDELAKHLTEKDCHLEQEGGPPAEAIQVSGRKRQLSAPSRLWSLSGQGGPAVGCCSTDPA